MTQALSPLATTDRLFFEREDAALDRGRAEQIVAEALSGCDDGELFLEYRENEHISLEDGRIRNAGFDSGSGFGLRAILGEETGYAHAGEMSEAALRRAAATVSAVRSGQGGTMAEPPRASNARLYADVNPLSEMDFAARTAILAEIDAYARSKDPRVKQVMASMYGEWQAVQIIRVDGRKGGRSAAAGAAQRQRRGGAGRAAGERAATAPAGGSAMSRLVTPEAWQFAGVERGAAAGAGEPGQPPGAGGRDGGGARAMAGPASCCTRRSGTGWRATSTARRLRPSPGCWASGSQHRA